MPLIRKSSTSYYEILSELDHSSSSLSTATPKYFNFEGHSNANSSYSIPVPIDGNLLFAAAIILRLILHEEEGRNPAEDEYWLKLGT